MVIGHNNISGHFFNLIALVLNVVWVFSRNLIICLIVALHILNWFCSSINFQTLVYEFLVNLSIILLLMVTSYNDISGHFFNLISLVLNVVWVFSRNLIISLIVVLNFIDLISCSFKKFTLIREFLGNLSVISLFMNIGSFNGLLFIFNEGILA